MHSITAADIPGLPSVPFTRGRRVQVLALVFTGFATKPQQLGNGQTAKNVEVAETILAALGEGDSWRVAMGQTLSASQQVTT